MYKDFKFLKTASKRVNCMPWIYKTQGSIPISASHHWVACMKECQKGSTIDKSIEIIWLMVVSLGNGSRWEMEHDCCMFSCGMINMFQTW